ncbi:glycosyltransferase [Rhizobium sp. KVB221]|uniref:Glycosyltransferase n=1 Tax=Rhizobium setariae TaxID=2801340 RepID=A0A936YR65_9HYPH|nr:glycosyltransferase [Rhizobium setariae]MBL0373061.1 glycosyltransferase [Rhizobium setariae]
MTKQKVIALFPEASYGAALNCIGIAQQLRGQGARPVFICHENFRGVFSEYGFAEYSLASGAGDGQVDWNAFINRHKGAFQQSPLEQISSYVAPTWDAIVDTAIRAEEPLKRLIAQIRPDAIVLDNVVMFPAVANAGVPWVRVVSCAETEIPDPLVPPYLSGCGAKKGADWDVFEARYAREVAPAHRRFNGFLAECSLKPYPAGQFLEASSHLNLLLSPEIVRFERKQPLDPQKFVYLDGCVRNEAPYPMPVFAAGNDKPLVLTSFGSLGAMDVAMIRRMISVFATLPFRFIVNAGPWRDDYSHIPDNVLLESWFPQPSVVEKSTVFIHHGGNNSFCEALYYGVPSLVMPYCWDGHDNARRAEETGTGLKLDRYRWMETELADAIASLAGDKAMHTRLKDNSLRMQAAAGVSKAAKTILDLL